MASRSQPLGPIPGFVPPAAPVRPDALPGPYVTSLEPDQEQKFQSWVKTNNVPWQDSPKSDYDMRGYWLAQQKGDPLAKQASNKHFPDTYKTPYHRSFSNESIYALPVAPHWSGDTLVDTKGNTVFTEPKAPVKSRMGEIFSGGNRK